MFYFYSLKIRDKYDTKIDINKVIDKLHNKYPRVNFIKFYYGECEEIVFLSDKELKGETFSTLSRISWPDLRPGFYKTRIKLMKKEMTLENIKNYFKNKYYSICYTSGSTFYRFGPNPKEAFDKYFTPQVFAAVAKTILKEQLISTNHYYDYI